MNENLVESKKYFEYGDLIISNLGDINTAGKCCAYLGNEKCLAGLGVTVVKHNQNPKYLSYALSSDFCRNQVNENSIKRTSSKGFRFWKEKIQQLEVPLPPIEEQEKIVSILDKFYSICEDMEDGIPDLIKGVMKQYEYYRDQIFK